MSKRASILDFYVYRIKQLIDTGASIRSVWKIILKELPEGVNISYPGFYRFCKRRGLIKK